MDRQEEKSPQITIDNIVAKLQQGLENKDKNILAEIYKKLVTDRDFGDQFERKKNIKRQFKELLLSASKNSIEARNLLSSFYFIPAAGYPQNLNTALKYSLTNADFYDDALACYHCGLIYEQLNIDDHALKYFKKSYKKAPKYFISADISHCLIKLDRCDEVSEYENKLIDIVNSEHEKSDLAKDCLASYYYKSKPLKNVTTNTILCLGEYCANNNDRNKAHFFLKEAKKNIPIQDEKNTQKLLGIFFKIKSYNEAITLSNSLLENTQNIKTKITSNINVGHCYLQQEQKIPSLVYLNKAFSLINENDKQLTKRDKANYSLELARRFIVLSEIDKTEKCLNKVFLNNPNKAEKIEAMCSLGDIYYIKHNYQKSLKLYNMAAKQDYKNIKNTIFSCCSRLVENYNGDNPLKLAYYRLLQKESLPGSDKIAQCYKDAYKEAVNILAPKNISITKKATRILHIKEYISDFIETFGKEALGKIVNPKNNEKIISKINRRCLKKGKDYVNALNDALKAKEKEIINMENPEIKEEKADNNKNNGHLKTLGPSQKLIECSSSRSKVKSNGYIEIGQAP